MATADQAPLYLDASAIVKLIAEEPESAELIEAVTDERLVSSELAIAEVLRAIRRIEHPDLVELIARADAVLATLALVPIGREVLTIAGAFTMPTLRALDAIHVASSLLLDDLGLFVSYDARQLRAAAEAGLAIASPGRA
ncbi:MAG TPA: type II toxin-antitoxin system VapC family toxin [Solirubrobacteraceae bacterium]|nr:type II toxin-antitoxin system VapC family toxin [Solirubrobacteraceae bacterium]